MVHQTALSRYGGWLPKSRSVYNAFFDEHIGRAHKKRSQDSTSHKDPVLAFQKAILSDSVMSALMDKIFVQMPDEFKKKIPDFDHLLSLIDEIIETAPKFQIGDDLESEPIGVPLYLLFDLLSNTGAAYDLFRMLALNTALKNLLNAWGDYLKTPPSNSTLTDQPTGWFGPAGLNKLKEKDRGDFNQTYETPDPTAVNRGYKSWDDFFTRKLQDGARGIEKADGRRLIYNACESTVYRIAKDVRAHDSFWLKGQAYSLWDMLEITPDCERETYVNKFVGGTVYQAFLSPQDYHRWHAPVNGTVVKTVVLPGTYYAVLPDDGAATDDPELAAGDPRGALIRSQAWISMCAARALIFIDADDKAIGLVCFIGVGMAEVSTCDVVVKENQKVKVGDQLGMFHFGGSSHTLIFGPHVDVTFMPEVVQDQHIRVNRILAEVY